MTLRPDLSQARKIYAWIDPALEEHGWEGSRFDIYELSDGRLVIDGMHRHIDADRDSFSRRVVSREQAAAEVLSCGDKAAVRRLFPESWQARALAAHGVARKNELEKNIEKLRSDAALRASWTGCELRESSGGVFVLSEAGKHSVVLPPELAGALKTAGADLRSLKALAPGSAEFRLLEGSGCASWAELEAAGWQPILKLAQFIFEQRRSEGSEGWIAAERLYEWQGIYLIEVARFGRAARDLWIGEKAWAIQAARGFRDFSEAEARSWGLVGGEESGRG